MAKMTREQKVEYLKSLDNETLVRRYASAAERVSNLFDWVNRGYDGDEILESEELHFAEILRRMEH